MNENEFWLFQNQGQNAIERKKGKMCNHMHFAQRPMLFCVFLYFFFCWGWQMSYNNWAEDDLDSNFGSRADESGISHVFENW